MKFSREWLADAVDVPAAPEELARTLTAIGFAVELVEAHGDDQVLDVEVTTNRPDTMCHAGLARELAVARGTALRLPEAAQDEPVPGGAAAQATSVALEVPELCPRFTAHLIRGVRVGPSPPWLVRRLAAVGARSINNVVDVTNYVMLELGQPLHAFDFATLEERRIRVRHAQPGEHLTTLDGVERQLEPEMLVIADATRPVGLAGIMGGAATEVRERTTEVLLESAHFDRRSVRRTARRLGMHTDASHRFERGADPSLPARAARRAARLIVELAGGELVDGLVDARSDEHLPRPAPIRLELARLSRFVGVAFDAAEVERILTGLGCTLEADGTAAGAPWRVLPPSWRLFDLELPADLYEEVLRHAGFDRIPATLPSLPGRDAAASPAHDRRERVRDHLAACGYAEAVDWAFHDAEADAALPTLLPDAEPVRLANPLSERHSVLRRSLLPGLLESARFNARRDAAAVRLFEVGGLFGAPEREAVALVGGGTLGTPWERTETLDLFDLKGTLESLAAACGVALTAEPAELPGFLPGRVARLRPRGEAGGVEPAVVGHLGELAADLPFPLFGAELLLDALGAGTTGRAIVMPSRFPSVPVDFTLTHRLETPWRELARAIDELRSPELLEFVLKDRYRGAGVPAGGVNTTIAFVYNAAERSLTQDEVNALHQRLAGELVRRFGWAPPTEPEVRTS